MTDKELLTLAAKAVGVEIEDWTGDTPRVVEMFRGHLPNYNEWNPLADDGDALRLAMELRLSIFLRPRRIEVLSWPSINTHVAHGSGGDLAPKVESLEPYGSDPHAATRRAIVRAAASIAKEQQI